MNKYCIPNVSGIREMREKLGVTQPDLAVEAGVGQATLSRLEDGGGARWTTIEPVLQALNRIIDRRERERLEKMEAREEARRRRLKRERDRRYRESMNKGKGKKEKREPSEPKKKGPTEPSDEERANRHAEADTYRGQAEIPSIEEPDFLPLSEATNNKYNIHI